MRDSPFTQYAGQTTIIGAKKDAQGNADGTQYDLAKDGAFDGQSIVVLHLYTGEGFDFVKPQKALERRRVSMSLDSQHRRLQMCYVQS